MNASVQIKTHSSSSASNKNTHIVRNSEAYKNPNFIVLEENYRHFEKFKKEKPAKAVLKKETERKSELKKINSAISVYTKRIEAITPPDDEEKRKRIQKLEEKRRELLKKREELKKAKEVAETRGRKQKHHYVEFVFSITNSNEYLANEEFVEVFIEVQNKFLKNGIFKELEIETNVVHLDQYSLHSHALFRLPDETTWEKHLSQFDAKDGRDAYKQVSKAWHNSVRNALFKNFGITLDNQVSGKRYKSLKTFKKENPIPNHEKVEKINSEPNMSDLSDISPHIRDLYEKAKANHKLVNSLFEKERTSEASERSDTSDSEQTESQRNRRNRR